MIKFIHLAIIMVAAYLPQAVWAMPTLALINIVFSVMFYWLCFGLLAGLKVAGINDEMEVADAWTSRVIQASATALLFMSNDPTYQYIAMISLPWIVINWFTDAFATLVKWEILEVTDKEE